MKQTTRAGRRSIKPCLSELLALTRVKLANGPHALGLLRPLLNT